jgi:hypothetical protein
VDWTNRVGLDLVRRLGHLVLLTIAGKYVARRSAEATTVVDQLTVTRRRR